MLCPPHWRDSTAGVVVLSPFCWQNEGKWGTHSKSNAKAMKAVLNSLETDEPLLSIENKLSLCNDRVGLLNKEGHGRPEYFQQALSLPDLKPKDNREN